MKEAADHVQRSQGNPWPLALNDSLHDPNNVPSPKSIPIKRVVKASLCHLGCAILVCTVGWALICNFQVYYDVPI